MTELTIFSPYALHREAWRVLLANQPGIRVIGEVGEMAALFPVSGKGPATLLVDLPSPQPEFVSQMKDRVPHAGLLILVDSYDIAEVIALLQAGATGLISRQETTGDLARAIIAAGRGEIVLPSEIAVQSLVALAQGQLAGQGFSEKISTASVPGGGDVQELRLAEPLTEREMEVLNFLAQGLTNKDIAQTMVLSVRTVEAHLRSVFGKLGVRSRTEAVLWAVRNGYGIQSKS
jgi:DNA-binding NarL/FixJ family response regulator